MAMGKRLRRIMVLFFACVLMPVASARGEDPTTLVFLMWKPNQPEVWDRLIHEFHQRHPGIHVQVQVGPHSSSEYHAIVTQRLKNKDTSLDVFFMDVIWPPEFASAGWALDLSTRFPAGERGKFLSSTISVNTLGNRIYGVPAYLAGGLFYFRKDLLERYRLPTPQTWRDMLDHGVRIVQGEDRPGLWGYSGQFKQYEGLVCNMLEFIWSNNGEVLDPRSGEVGVDRPAAVEAIRFVRDNIIGGAAPRGSLNYEEPESLQLFIQGKAVFHRNWPYAWAVAQDPERSRISGKVGVAGLPAFEGGDSSSVLGGWQFGISRWSEHVDSAWKFIQFMTSHRAQTVLAAEASLAPTRRSVYRSPEIQRDAPHLKLFLPVFETARPRPLSPIYPMISQELQRLFSRSIVEKSTDIPALVENASENLEKLVRLGASVRK
jgi:multiple sugar transport system substrate-binding protein